MVILSARLFIFEAWNLLVIGASLVGSADAWSQVRVEFKKALALRSQIRRAGSFKLGS